METGGAPSEHSEPTTEQNALSVSRSAFAKPGGPNPAHHRWLIRWCDECTGFIIRAQARFLRG